MQTIALTRPCALLVGALVVLLAGLCAGTAMPLENNNDTMELRFAVNISQDPSERSRLSRDSDPLAILHAAFEHSGWNADEAMLHAQNAYARLGIEGYVLRPAPSAPASPRDDASGPPLDPGTDPFEIIMDVFHSTGWSFAEAYLHTTYSFARLGVKGYAYKPRLSHPLRTLREAFQSSGWSFAEALVHAENAFARLGITGYDLKSAPRVPANPTIHEGRSLLSPSSDPLAVLVDVLVSAGWDMDEASRHAEAALIKAGADVLQSELQCQVRSIVIQYCEEVDGSLFKKFWRGFVNELCYEQLFVQNPEFCAIPNCPLGEVPWFTMTTKQGCQFPFAGCVRVSFASSAQTTPCSNPNVLQCNCFAEQHCSEIGTVECCPPLSLTGNGGCTGCPCDE